MGKVLCKLGLEDCFDGIVNFESLNPTNKTNDFDAEILGAADDFSALPKTPIVCKPFPGAFEQAFKIANIKPEKTVRK